ncbi:hypothetical protein KP509_01G010400 [Ceratopteris richardii]|nr:hypothetical protein KP509_01G010400 [Ceratopteris richardii]KAH7445465.1 hypothetical protein KP509_01G010400 [Ceratopteris richardii]
MGEFVIEYCGEVISSEEARTRSQNYESEGMQDAYIISLSGSEFIDATRKGSLGRFINHSCDPNCETRKWTVLGEVRVGIFAKKDIKTGTELTYNYNFEWYGGAKVRCRCGAASCVGFLGAKSRGFQEDTYVWEDNDDRFSVENVPLYDSEDDEPLSTFFKKAQVGLKFKKLRGSIPSKSGEKTSTPHKAENTPKTEPTVELKLDETVETNNVHATLQHEVLMGDEDKPIKEEETDNVSTGVVEKNLQSEKNEEQDSKKQKQGVLSLKRMGAEKLGLFQKRSRFYSNQYSNSPISSRIKAQDIHRHILSQDACDQLVAAEEAEVAATLELNRLHDKLRPTMEELGKDGPDSLPMSMAEEWIAVTCKQMAAVLNFNHTAMICLARFAQDEQVLE